MSTPTYVGQVGSYFSNTATVSTQPVTTTAAVAIGDTLFVTTKGQGNYGTACTDSVGNTYTRLGTTTSGPAATMFGCVVTVAMPIGTVITATMNAASVNQQAYAFVFRNVTLSGPVATAASSSTTTHTTGSVTPEQVTGIVLSFCTINGAYYLSQRTTTAGFAQLPLTVAGNQEWSQVAWKQVNPSGITSTSVLWEESSGGRNWQSVTAALNATSGDFLAIF